MRKIDAVKKAESLASGTQIVAALSRKLEARTQSALGAQFGLKLGAVQGWERRKRFTADQIAELVVKAQKTARKAAYQDALRPLVEFFPNIKCPSKQGAKSELFDSKKSSYLTELRDELENSHGVYVFFDSSGHAIYVGKARTNLWTEMTLAFNRERGDVQSIRRVRHPKTTQPYRSSDEKARQIDDCAVPLHELATYFSAYRVADGLIGELEALLIRSFANGLLNKQMARFGQQKRI